VQEDHSSALRPGAIASVEPLAADVDPLGGRRPDELTTSLKDVGDQARHRRLAVRAGDRDERYPAGPAIWSIRLVRTLS
jgi:hypothetical protein